MYKRQVYNTAIRTSQTGAEWDFLYERFLNCEVDSERRRMIYGLGSSWDESILNEYLARSIDANSGIRKQDTPYLYSGVGASDIGRMTQMTWLEENYIAIKEYHGPSFPSRVGDIISRFGNAAKTQAEYDRISDFWNQHQVDLASAQSTFGQVQDLSLIHI